MKHLFQAMNDQIRPSPELNEMVMDSIRPRKIWNLRPVGAIAAMLAVVLLATPVMAAYIPPINDLMYQVSPQMAERFTPIQKSCVKNGIKMEVVSASVHGNVAEMVVSREETAR